MDAYSSDASVPSKKKPHGIKLRNLILSDELRPKEQKTPTIPNITFNSTIKKSHQRSQSDASALGIRRTSSAGDNRLCLGDLTSGRAFDNGCTCYESCRGVVNDLRGKKTECTCSVRGTSLRKKFRSLSQIF